MSATKKAAAPPPRAFEDVLELAKMALPSQGAGGKDSAVAVETIRQYLSSVPPGRRDAPLLVAARHVLLRSRESGRPSLVSYACRAVLGTMVPRLMQLCDPEWHSGGSCDSAVARYHDNGLFGNILQVCDLLLLCPAGCRVEVDWRRKGEEGHFQYGPPDFDLFGHLFEQTDRCHGFGKGKTTGGAASVLEFPSRINCLFMNMLRGYVWTLPPEDLSTLRSSYAEAMRELRPTQAVMEKVEAVCREWGARGTHVVGVHKRLSTAEVAAVQLSQRAPLVEEFIEAARRVVAGLERNGLPVTLYLASDDSAAVSAFREAFPNDDGGCGGIQLCVRENVKRTLGGTREDGVYDEVHRSPCEVTDAEDAVVDALCLSRCADLVCIDSNVSIFAALRNPALRLHPINGLLPDGWEEEATKPQEPVFQEYTVAHKPMVFVRAGPSAATSLVGARKFGEAVATTGRAYAGWVEVMGDPGGWMLVDAERMHIGQGQGLLMEGTGPPWPQAALGA